MPRFFSPSSPEPTRRTHWRSEHRSAPRPLRRCATMRLGYPAFRAFYDVLPATYEECEPFVDQPMTNDPAGRSFARSRAEIVTKLAESMSTAGVVAMVYPTMPFNAPRAADPWPDV